jgi:hypothetical protein
MSMGLNLLLYATTSNMVSKFNSTFKVAEFCLRVNKTLSEKSLSFILPNRDKGISMPNLVRIYVRMAFI